MDAEEYSKQASKFFNRKLSPTNVLINASMGCAGEAGEFVDHIKKVAFHGHDLDVAHIVKELGDQLWYINYAIYALQLLGYADITLSSVMQVNVLKLEARYPRGFSHEASRSRVSEAAVVPMPDPTILKESKTATLYKHLDCKPNPWIIRRKKDLKILGEFNTYAAASLAWDAYHSDEAAARLGSRS